MLRAACAVLALLGAHSAGAECFEGRVSYAAPPTCPDAQYLCDRLMDRSGAKLALDPTSRVSVDIAPSGQAGRFEISGPEGSLAARDFAATAEDGCVELVRTIASSLVAALGTTPDAPTSSPTSPAPPAPEESAAPPPSRPVLAAAPIAEPEPAATPSWSAEWVVGVSVSSGWAPAPTWGARLGAALRGEGPLSFGLDARLESTLFSAELEPDVLVDTVVLAVSPSVCAAKSLLVLCADVVAGAVRSTSEGLQGAGAASSFTFAAGVRFGVSGEIATGLRGALLADVHTAVVALELLAGEILLWRSPPVSLGLSLVLSGSLF